MSPNWWSLIAETGLQMGGTRCFFVSDLHGKMDRYRKLFDAILSEAPMAVFMAGDLLPHHLSRLSGRDGFTADVLADELAALRSELNDSMPRVLLILGNDDERAAESAFIEGDADGNWQYLHRTRVPIGRYLAVGYSCVPPTPFMLKDWERYDVGRFVDPGCVSPEEGCRTTPFDLEQARYRTIAADMEELLGDRSFETTILMTHSPPYKTALDRAALDGRSIDGAPLDVHVGSVAIRRAIEDYQPLVSLHGHIHESTRITGSWRDRIGATHCFNAAHDGPELALVRFDLGDLEAATRELV